MFFPVFSTDATIGKYEGEKNNTVNPVLYTLSYYPSLCVPAVYRVSHVDCRHTK